jgi:Septum formation
MPSSTASNSPTASTSQLTYDQLRPGDCVQVPNINTINGWPEVYMVVPCAQQHTGEVFFTGNVWPQSIAYSGDNVTSNQAEARCSSAFATYVGVPPDQSIFTYAWHLPDSISWLSGDRSVQCIAYDPNGAPIDYSIKDSTM